MIHLTKALWRRWLDTLFHIHDTPERTASAFALGVFLGFSPFLGLHTIVGVALAFLFNLNRVAVLLGVYSNLPWIIGGYYALTTIMGAALTGVGLPPDFRERLVQMFEMSLYSSAFWSELGRLLSPLLVPFVVGSTLGAVALATVAYFVSRAFLQRRHRHRQTGDG
jgi:uncharacterized protein (DUF2062 family)